MPPPHFALALALTLTLVAAPAWARVGIDISLEQCNAEFSQDSIWKCFASNGYDFAVIQAAQGNNNMTASIAACMANAKANGFSTNVYVWACPVCPGQEDGFWTGRYAVEALAAQGIRPGIEYELFFMDIEDCDPYDNCWLDFEANQAYVLAFVAGMQAAGASVGLYASPYEWNKLMGSTTWTNAALDALPLWYPSWDYKTSSVSSVFVPFGGFTKPMMHQYAAKSPVCESAVDLDMMDS